jgi:hypothetical protein
VSRGVPPVKTLYQLIVPELAVAPNTTVPVPQRLAGVLAVIVGIVFTITVTAVEVSLHQFALLTNTR